MNKNNLFAIKYIAMSCFMLKNQKKKFWYINNNNNIWFKKSWKNKNFPNMNKN